MNDVMRIKYGEPATLIFHRTYDPNLLIRFPRLLLTENRMM